MVIIASPFTYIFFSCSDSICISTRKLDPVQFAVSTVVVYNCASYD